jgi:hypothetical protein
MKGCCSTQILDRVKHSTVPSCNANATGLGLFCFPGIMARQHFEQGVLVGESSQLGDRQARRRSTRTPRSAPNAPRYPCTSRIQRSDHHEALVWIPAMVHLAGREGGQFDRISAGRAVSRWEQIHLPLHGSVCIDTRRLVCIILAACLSTIKMD